MLNFTNRPKNLLVAIFKALEQEAIIEKLIIRLIVQNECLLKQVLFPRKWKRIIIKNVKYGHIPMWVSPNSMSRFFIAAS